MTPLTLYEFKFLDELEQFEAIWASGVELGKRSDATYHYTLYSLWGFYVEIKRHIEFDVWHGLQTFTTTRMLEPYLNTIDISKVT